MDDPASNFYQSILLQTIEKAESWGITFSGQRHEDANRFLINLVEKCDNRGIKINDRHRILIEVLKGPALKWYRFSKLKDVEWDEFVKRFYKIFIPDGLQSYLHDQIWTRRQSEGESTLEFITDMADMYSRLPTQDYEQKNVKHIRDCLLPDFFRYMYKCNAQTYDELFLTTLNLEKLWDDEAKRRNNGIVEQVPSKQRVANQRNNRH